VISKYSFAYGVVLLAILVVAPAASGQSAAFTYQGQLTDGGNQASGNYDFQFLLWDSLKNGAQIGSIQELDAVAVVSGSFSVTLDFGAGSFTGANRFLEIRVRKTGTVGFVIFDPRQPITATPYAVQALNATTAAAANGLTTATSANFIQNTQTPQAVSNFNVSGDGTAGGTLSGNVVSTPAQYNLGSSRILIDAGENNLFVGIDAGAVNTNTDPRENTFIGAGAGQNNGTGPQGGIPAIRNTFVGSQAGNANIDGQDNSFFGSQQGKPNTSGFRNSFFGATDPLNATGFENSFFGNGAGSENVGQDNSFFGELAGPSFSAGNNNGFFGALTGNPHERGSNNTYVGFEAQSSDGQVDPNFDHATGIGANTVVTSSNAIVLGRTVGGTFDNVGIGISAPTFKLHVLDAGATGLRVQTNSIGGKVASFGTGGAFQIDAVNVPGGRFTILQSGNVGIGGPTPFDKLDVIGTIRIATLGSGASTTETLCRNNINQISICSSSLRYKTRITPFAAGLQFIKQLQPITFDWKQGGMHDVGFGAEDVARLNPLFVTYSEDGQVEGVKYDRFATLFVNAFKEQQTQIEAQRQLIRTQQARVQRQRATLETQREQIAADTQKLHARIEAQQRKLARQQQVMNELRRIFCRTNAGATICKEN
jgi:endosialidase-like protein